jgi:hypothetical protein
MQRRRRLVGGRVVFFTGVFRWQASGVMAASTAATLSAGMST